MEKTYATASPLPTKPNKVRSSHAHIRPIEKLNNGFVRSLLSALLSPIQSISMRLILLFAIASISSISASETYAQQSVRRAPRSRTARPMQRAAEVKSLPAISHLRKRWTGRIASSSLKPRKRLMLSSRRFGELYFQGRCRSRSHAACALLCMHHRTY